jgi:phosphoribosyl 1,2-cyclic phosphodiesterase
MKNLSTTEFVVKFWGVRGSIPCPGPSTVRYGGNTSCIEMRIGGKHLIFDGGTGLRQMAKSLEDEMPLQTYMFFTHYHWDHIQGIPFFSPLFTEGNRLFIHGQVPDEGEKMNLEEHFYKRVLHTNSPVPVKAIKADIQFHDIVCGETFFLDDIEIDTIGLNHPNGAMGYRVAWNGHAIAYCTDTEHFPDRLDENIIKLAQDADILIYDAMYTDEEYHDPKSPKVGWGHSTWQEGLKVAKAAGVKRLAVFHHEPNHSDEIMDRITEEVKASCENAFVAKEGLEVSVIPQD